MIIGFVIWSAVAVVLIGIGIGSYRADKPVGFFTGVKPPEVKDVKGYNHSVGLLWIIFAVLFECLGLPLLFLEQNSLGFLPVIFLTVFWAIALAVIYTRIEAKYRK